MCSLLLYMRENISSRLISLNTDVLNPKSDLPNELLYGRVGYLYALLFINTHIEPAPVDDKLIREVILVICLFCFHFSRLITSFNFLFRSSL